MSEMFGKNIKYLRTLKGLGQAQMLDFTGISKATWSDYERNKTEPDFSVLLKISDFFEVYVDDLLTKDVAVLDATGNLIRKNSDSENRQKGNPNSNPLGNLKPKNSDNSDAAEDFSRPYILNEQAAKTPKMLAPKVITVDSSGNENVLYVPVKARAGYLTGMADPKYIQSLPAYGLPGYHNGTYRIFEINGPSMFPTFQDKDRCVTRWSEVSDIRDDRVYIVVTSNDGILIKRCINRMQEGKIICKSDNNFSGEYPPIVLEVSEILEVWYVVERWTRQMPGPGEIYKRIVNLEAAVTLLTHRLDHPR